MKRFQEKSNLWSANLPGLNKSLNIQNIKNVTLLKDVNPLTSEKSFKGEKSILGLFFQEDLILDPRHEQPGAHA